jgi:phenylacetate-CoA ligase
VAPFLYENSAFYRARFDRLNVLPSDIRIVDDLAKWPVVDKTEMMADVQAHPPFGTYTTHDDALWAERGWMLFSSSGSTGIPRVFRYSQLDRELWSWANARALHAFGIRPSDSLLICAGYGPHVFAWGCPVRHRCACGSGGAAACGAGGVMAWEWGAGRGARRGGR